MGAREVMARAISIHDSERVPDGFADRLDATDDPYISDWSAYLACRTIDALNKAGYCVVPLAAVPPSLDAAVVR